MNTIATFTISFFLYGKILFTYKKTLQKKKKQRIPPIMQQQKMYYNNVQLKYNSQIGTKLINSSGTAYLLMYLVINAA